jgi:hypothetical protein
MRVPVRDPYCFVHRNDPKRLWFDVHYFTIEKSSMFEDMYIFTVDTKKSGKIADSVFASVRIKMKDGKLDFDSKIFEGPLDCSRYSKSLFNHLKHHAEFYSNFAKSSVAINKYNI